MIECVIIARDAEDTIGRAIEMIDANAFYRSAHAKLFDAIVALYNSSTPADLITVSEELKKRGDLEAVGGPAFLAQIMEYATTAANIEQHVKIVHSKAILRALDDAGLGADAKVVEPTDEESARVHGLLREQGIDATFSFKHVVAEQKLWYFDSRDPEAWLKI